VITMRQAEQALQAAQDRRQQARQALTLAEVAERDAEAALAVLRAAADDPERRPPHQVLMTTTEWLRLNRDHNTGASGIVPRPIGS